MANVISVCTSWIQSIEWPSNCEMVLVAVPQKQKILIVDWWRKKSPAFYKDVAWMLLRIQNYQSAHKFTLSCVFFFFSKLFWCDLTKFGFHNFWTPSVIFHNFFNPFSIPWYKSIFVWFSTMLLLRHTNRVVCTFWLNHNFCNDVQPLYGTIKKKYK